MAEKVCLHFEFIYFAVVKYLDKKITLKTKGGRLFLLVGWLVFFKFTIHTAGKSQRQELETASHVALQSQEARETNAPLLCAMWLS